MKKIDNNCVSLAGEFAVLSQLSLLGYDANLTLGHTKGVDILVSNPRTEKMCQLEVKANFQNRRKDTAVSKVFGKSIGSWMMNKKHEKDRKPTLFYCFVSILKGTNSFKFYIVPSRVVARYVAKEHAYWLQVKKSEGTKVKDTEMRTLRIGIKGQKYPLVTPLAEQYENMWRLLG